jgi:hypothetical protein
MDNIPRNETTLNAKNLSKMDIARRKNDVKELQEKYPQLPSLWLDMLWNFWNEKGEEEVQKIIDSGEWEKPPKHQYAQGGLFKDAIIVEEKNNE